MRRAFLVLLFATELSTALHAQSSTYFGVIVRDPDSLVGDSGFFGRMRLHVSVAGSQTLASVAYGQARSDGDSGWVVRWGDTLFAVTHSALGDTVLWLGVRRGGGFIGRRYIMRGPEFATRTRFLLNLASGDSLPAARVPYAELRAWMNVYLDALRLHLESTRATSRPSPPPVQPQSASDDVLGYAFLLVVFSPYLIWTFGFAVKRLKAARDAARRRWLAARVRWRRSSARVRYAVPCPICRAAQMEAAQEYYMIRGRGLFTSLDRRVAYGCERCVRRVGLRTAFSTLHDGAWSVGGIIAAPCSALFNVVRALDLRDRTLVERLLREADLEPLMVRMDGDGLVPADRARLNTHLWICARVVWAAGTNAARAREEALKFLNDSVEGRLKTPRLEQLITEMRGKLAAHRPIQAEERAAIYRLTKRLVLAHGEFSPALSTAVHEVAILVNLTPHDLAELLREITESLRGTASSSAGAKEKSSDAGARAGAKSQGGTNSGTGQGSQRERSAHGDSNSGRTRRRRVTAEEIARARTVLNVGPNASAEEIERAYRTVISIWHPDRAGLDPRRQKEFTVRSQEITWAKEALRVAAQAKMAS